MEPFVQKQFDEYQANRVDKDIVSKEELRELLIKDLSFVSKMVWSYFQIILFFPKDLLGV